MSSNIYQIAEAVIRKAGRDHPADAVLRDQLRRTRDLGREDGRVVARLVFTYFRWLGWLDGNAPLRRNLDQAEKLAATFAQNPRAFPAEELRARAVPSWVREEVEMPVEWLRTLQTEPTLWLRARPGQAAALQEKLRHCRRARNALLDSALAYDGGEDLFRTELFQAGEFEVQDIASQAVGSLCAPQPGETWWDACAGEGGKLLHLSDLMQNKGLIWATDRAAWRLRRLKLRAARAGVFNYRAALWDNPAKLPTNTKFDGVLVDAPCSGLGTWQRNPHARWTTTRQDVEELARAQAVLLARAAAAVRPGGRLIYAACTLTRAETSGVATRMDSELSEFAPLPLTNPFRPEEAPVARLWLWPQITGGNAMFIAAWQKGKQAVRQTG